MNRPSSFPFKATTELSTKTPFLQLPPIAVRIVHCDLTPCHDAPRNHQDSFSSAPVEFLELAIRTTRVVYESCEVPHVALEDLIRARAGAANHYIDTLHAVGY